MFFFATTLLIKYAVSSFLFSFLATHNVGMVTVCVFRNSIYRLSGINARNIKGENKHCDIRVFRLCKKHNKFHDKTVKKCFLHNLNYTNYRKCKATVSNCFFTKPEHSICNEPFSHKLNFFFFSFLWREREIIFQQILINFSHYCCW
jgi:hypothetical protein